MTLREHMRDARAAYSVAEADYLHQAIEAAGGNLKLAARDSGLSRTHFYRLLAKHGMRDMVALARWRRRAVAP